MDAISTVHPLQLLFWKNRKKGSLCNIRSQYFQVNIIFFIRLFTHIWRKKMTVFKLSLRKYPHNYSKDWSPCLSQGFQAMENWKFLKERNKNYVRKDIYNRRTMLVSIFFFFLLFVKSGINCIVQWRCIYSLETYFKALLAFIFNKQQSCSV